MAPIAERKRSLLLLPTLSLPLTRTSLSSAYEQTLQILFTDLRKDISPEDFHRLDIVLVLSSSYPLSSITSRTALFPAIQSLLEKVYTLVCLAASKAHVELDFPGGFDVRLLVLDPRTNQLPHELVRQQILSGPLVDIPTFVAAQSKSSIDVYTVESEDGIMISELFVRSWQDIHKSSLEVKRLPCGPALTNNPSFSASNNAQNNAVDSTGHSSVAVGGTFDHLHIGHKLLLTAIVFLASQKSSQPRKITIGITNEALLAKKKYSSVLESWETRQERTAEFVEWILVIHPDPASIRSVETFDSEGPNGHVVQVAYGKDTEDEIVVDYVAISDPFGPTITDEAITALVISKETRAGGKAVNDKRTEKGWKELEIFEVDVLDASFDRVGDEEKDHEAADQNDFASKISSTEIRKKLEARLA